MQIPYQPLRHGVTYTHIHTYIYIYIYIFIVSIVLILKQRNFTQTLKATLFEILFLIEFNVFVLTFKSQHSGDGFTIIIDPHPLFILTLIYTLSDPYQVNLPLLATYP